MVTAKLLSVFVFAIWIEQYLFFVNPKFQASSHLLLHSLVCDGPGRKPRRPVFSQRGSYVFIGARFDDGAGGDNEVQRTMLELINQLDGFDPRGNIKVLMATNRPDTLDPALMRPGRLDRKIEFGLPDLEVITNYVLNKAPIDQQMWICLKMQNNNLNNKTKHKNHGISRILNFRKGYILKPTCHVNTLRM